MTRQHFFATKAQWHEEFYYFTNFFKKFHEIGHFFYWDSGESAWLSEGIVSFLPVILYKNKNWEKILSGWVTKGRYLKYLFIYQVINFSLDKLKYILNNKISKLVR